MLELFLSFSMRKKLKKYKKTGEPILISLSRYAVIATVSEVGLFTATIQILDADEETWLAEEILPICSIEGICTKSVLRGKRKLMISNGEDWTEEYASESCEEE